MQQGEPAGSDKKKRVGYLAHSFLFLCMGRRENLAIILFKAAFYVETLTTDPVPNRGSDYLRK